MMDLKTFYGLSMDPFAKGALPTKDAFQSNDLKALLNRLRYLVNVRGVGVFTASPGMGKSYGIRCFQKELNENLYKVVYLCLTTISVAEFYKQICDSLGLDVRGGKTVMFKTIQEQIYYLYKEKRQPLVLILDEAQYLSPGILRDLKMLMNFEYDSLNCFTLILSAEPYFNKTLEKPVNEALRQRIVVHYNFGGLDPNELNAYVIHKIKFAGGSESIIGADALSALNGYCGGNARTVDNVMSTALTLGAQLEHQTIDAEIIMAAINEITLD